MKGRIVYGRKFRYYVDDREVTREEFDETFPAKPIETGEPPAGPALTGWPIISDALKVHPKRRQEAVDDAVKKGVPTEFTKAGQPILRNREHRKAYLKAYGFRDRHSFYGY